MYKKIFYYYFLVNISSTNINPNLSTSIDDSSTNKKNYLHECLYLGGMLTFISLFVIYTRNRNTKTKNFELEKIKTEQINQLEKLNNYIENLKQKELDKIPLKLNKGLIKTETQEISKINEKNYKNLEKTVINIIFEFFKDNNFYIQYTQNSQKILNLDKNKIETIDGINGDYWTIRGFSTFLIDPKDTSNLFLKNFFPKDEYIINIKNNFQKKISIDNISKVIDFLNLINNFIKEKLQNRTQLLNNNISQLIKSWEEYKQQVEKL